MRLMLLFTAFAFTLNGSFAQRGYTHVTPSPFNDVVTSCLDIADIDGDADLDVLIMGRETSGSWSTKLYKNNGAGSYNLMGGTSFVSGTDGVIKFEDLDGDDDQDVLIFANLSVSDSEFVIYMNDGTGVFTPQTFFTGPSNTDLTWTGVNFEFEDVDGDSDKDLALQREGLSEVTALYLNDGAGNFSPYPGLGDVSNGSLAFADIDNDSDQDLVVSGISGPGTRTYLHKNDGNGNFTIVSETPFPGTTGGIAFVDAENDGDPDLLLAGTVNGTLLFLNDGAGNFVLDDPTQFSGGQNTSVDVADANGDGFADIILSGRKTEPVGQVRYVHLFLNDGNGNFALSAMSMSFTAEEGEIKFADVDGDDDQDLIIADQLYIQAACTSDLCLETLAPPVITSFTPETGPAGVSVIIAGTGFSTVPSNNIVYFGAVQAEVTEASADTLMVSVPAGATYSPITVLTNGAIAWSSRPFILTFTGTGSFTFEKTDISTDSESPTYVSMADFDGDGKSDLAVGNSSSDASASIFRNNSTGVDSINFDDKINYVIPEPSIPSLTDPIEIITADLNGDGKLDFATSSRHADALTIFTNVSTNPGAISLSHTADYTVTCPQSVSSADLDLDGKNDLAVASNCKDTVTVYRNTSTAVNSLTFTPARHVQVPGPLSIAWLYGEDGKSFLEKDEMTHMLVLSDDMNAWHFRNASAGPGNVDFLHRGWTHVRTTPGQFLATDLDGNGTTEIVMVNSADNKVYVIHYSNIAREFQTGAFPVSLAAGDVNGDGKPDIVTANRDDNTISILTNTSTINDISFANKIDLPAGNSPISVSLGDLDGNSMPEVVVANYGSKTISVFRNIMVTLSTETDIISYSLPHETGPAVIDAESHTIQVEVAEGTDITELVATLSLSPGATAQVNTVGQISGSTPNDFTNPVVYTVTAENGVATHNWIVTVTVESAPNQGPHVSDKTFAVDENSTEGTLIGLVTATDPDNDNLIFSIKTGNESGAFHIHESVGLLSVADPQPLDFETTPFFNLAIEVSDGHVTDVAVITINLNDVDDIPVGIEAVDPKFDVTTFPNPATHQLAITVHSHRSIDSSLSVYNVFGEQILQQEFLLGPEAHIVDIRDFAKSIYFVVISNNEFKIVRKIIKQ